MDANNCKNCGYSAFDRLFGEFKCLLRKIYIYDPLKPCAYWKKDDREKKEEE